MDEIVETQKLNKIRNNRLNYRKWCHENREIIETENFE